ncbi:hypothetical protein [Pseudomonas sp.]|uniref:hypothetical protein n=1 Tax=Pseudomonas sp. TaxID=306 RepID=UPI00257CF541|nr:hypothetical protein [Pseudomonas sp.]
MAVAEFATIVGLLSAFTSGRSATEQAKIADFYAWLSEHNHEMIRESLESKQVTAVSIKALLNRGLDDVTRKLDDISTRIAILVSRSDGIENLALAYPGDSLSDQCLELLSFMDKHGVESFLITPSLDTSQQGILFSSGPEYICKEPFFLKDDLSLMVSLGLLIKEYTSKGSPVYYYTRSASKLIASMEYFSLLFVIVFV